MQDRGPYVAFIRRHQAAVWRFLRVLDCTPDEASRLAVEVFAQFFTQPCTHYSTRLTTAYLLDLARQLLIRQRRRGTMPLTDPQLALWNRLEAAWTREAGRDGGESLLQRVAAVLEEADPTVRERLLRWLRRQAEGRPAGFAGDDSPEPGPSERELSEPDPLADDSAALLERLRACLKPSHEP